MSSSPQRADAGRGTACWLPELRRRGRVDARLFCFPHAGGAVSTFANWPEQLQPRLDVRPVHLPGRATRRHEPSLTQASAIIVGLAPALIPLLDRPFAIFGHSMGALLAFETTRFLRRHGLPLPACLIVSGRRAPHLPDPDFLSQDASDDSIIAWLREKNGTPGEVLDDVDLMTFMLPMLRADLRVCQSYAYRDEPPLACPIVALGGHGDEECGGDRLEGWQQHTASRCTVRRFPGDHFYLRSAEPLLLDVLRSSLVTALPALGSGTDPVLRSSEQPVPEPR